MAALASMTATSIAVGCGSDGGYGVVDPLPRPGTSGGTSGASSGTGGSSTGTLSVTAKLVDAPGVADAGADGDADASVDAGTQPGDRYVELDLSGGSLGGAKARDGLTNEPLQTSLGRPAGGFSDASSIIVRVPKGVHAFVVEAQDYVADDSRTRHILIKAEISPDGEEVMATVEVMIASP